MYYNQNGASVSLVSLFLSVTVLVGLTQANESLTVNDVDGKQHIVVDPNRPASQSSKKATVLIFINVDCPIANSYHPELTRLAEEFCGVNESRDFAILLVHANPSLTILEAKKHQQDFRIQVPIVLDPEQHIAKAMKASVTPEAILVDPTGSVLYRGRIDDRFTAFGRKRVAPQREDLRLALQSIADGRPIEVSITQAIGCRIAVLD